MARNEVNTFSRDFKINTAGSASSGELQTALSNWLCETKKEVAASLHNFLCILFSRSLSNLKEKYTTTFGHKHIHCITQSKASRSIMAANTLQPGLPKSKQTFQLENLQNSARNHMNKNNCIGR